MIPKIIHYCWFGGNPLPELAQKCIKSWKKYCPDYEIKRWDETNFDITSCNYIREAYKEKMWAFVSDYARFKILYENGGMYLDTDVELIAPMDDIIERGPFMGLEVADRINVATGLGFAVYAGHNLIKEILESYHNTHFTKNEDGFYETVVERVTHIILKYDNIYPDKISEVAGIVIYPPEYFCPINFKTGKMTITENTHSIHHYTASWFNKIQRTMLSINRRFVNLPHVAKFLVLPLLCVDIILNGGVRSFVKHVSKKIQYCKKNN